MASQLSLSLFINEIRKIFKEYLDNKKTYHQVKKEVSEISRDDG